MMITLKRCLHCLSLNFQAFFLLFCYQKAKIERRKSWVIEMERIGGSRTQIIPNEGAVEQEIYITPLSVA